MGRLYSGRKVEGVGREIELIFRGSARKVEGRWKAVDEEGK